MFRGLAIAVVFAAVFGGVVFGGGRALGVWGTLPAPPGASALGIDDTRSERPARVAARAAGTNRRAKAAKRAARHSQAVIRWKAADQAAARGVVLTKADLGAGWKGGARKVDQSPEISCANFKPKLSDIVYTGAARTGFTHADGLSVGSEVTLAQTPRMVRLHWKRVFGHPNGLGCLRRTLVRDAAADGVRNVSVNRTPFPRVAPHTIRHRVIYTVETRSGRRIRMLFDQVGLGVGRWEISLLVGAPFSDRLAADVIEVGLAKLLVDRARS